MSFFALGRLQNHKVPHLHPNSTMFMPLDRLQLKIYAFSGKFNVCSKRVLLSWIKICRDFTLQTQIFTQKYRSWLRFYSEFLRKNLAAEVSGLAKCLIKLNLRNVQEYFAITWNSNTTQTNWFYSDFVQTIWAKICWVEALFCKFLYFRVSSSDPKCPPATDPASLGERPCVHQWANSFANLRNCKNKVVL